MATENKILDVSVAAAEDLSSDQYTFVVLTSSGVRRPDSETETLYGILQNAPESGDAAVVRLIGISKLAVNAALSVGDFVKAEYVGASDAGKGKSASGALAYARAMVLEASSAEDDMATVLLIDQIPGFTPQNLLKTTVTTDATADANTWTAAELIGGMMLRDPAGGARTDVTPTAAEIVAALPNCVVGSSFYFVIRNTADAAETITLSGGTNVTISGTATIAQNNSKLFLAVVTNATSGSEAVTVYSIGTMVH